MSVGGGMWGGGAGVGYADLPALDTAATTGGGGTAPTSAGFTPVTDRGSDAYGLLVGTTPGLVHWWRFAQAFANWGGKVDYAPFFSNSAGAGALGAIANVPSLGAPFVKGSPGSVRLNNGHLWGFEYHVTGGNDEIITLEAWVKPLSLPADGAICASWQSGVGYLLHLQNTGAVTFNIHGQAVGSPAGTIAVGGTYHVVGVCGGVQAANPDYTSRLYVNGVEVGNANLSPNQAILGSSDQFRVGNFASGAGGSWDGYVAEVAIYSRMLQPAEVLAHYNAGK